MTKIPVNKDVLVWAREERGLSRKQAADRLKISESELEEIEAGDRLPSVGELRRMAAKYEIGFSALLMPERLPTNTRLNVQDFRTHESSGERWHPDLLAEMDDINVLIDAMADLRAAEPSLFPNSLPAIRMGSSPARAAHDERERLGLTLARQESWKSDADAFRRLRASKHRVSLST